ncbi:MAG TPA: NAD-dependent epimerase/dehydratase family protein [Pseudolabrys sp.]|nr:NAD-dependent epimerase/dehydratase family protein [Pseudolabrys sp.]
MLNHLQTTPANPARVVVLGAGGFVGSATAKLLRSRNISTLALGRNDVDLLADNATQRLRALLKPTDALVVVSAKAPCKNVAMLGENIRMMSTVCDALTDNEVAHVVYISSDAVYRDSTGLLNEESCAEPSSLHGVMHLAREVMLKSVETAPLAILRPTLIYGNADPHNGYGPNRFRRLAAEGKDIVLFGDGEERRDHVSIDDVATIIVGVLQHRSKGTLNIATGEVHSFRSIAEMVADTVKPAVAVRGTERAGPMPHNGYRAFDPAATHIAFPDFSYLSLGDGLKRL